MRHILLLALALLCAPVQAAFDCLPETLVTPPGISTGSTSVAVETPAADADAWWCPYFVDGNLKYKPNTRWSLKSRRTTYDWRAAYTRIKAAPNLLAAVNGELTATAVGTTPGTQDAYEVDLVKHRACLALATKPYLVPIIDLPTDWCGPVPTPPAAGTVTWLTPNSLNLKVYSRAAGDKLGPAIAGRTAPPNNSCNYNAPRVTLGTSVYFPLSGGPLNELYLCRLVQ